MPGLVGFTTGKTKSTSADCALERMRSLITHFDSYVEDQLFSDGSVCCSGARLDVLKPLPRPYFESGIYIWVDGEIFNANEFIIDVKAPAKADTALARIAMDGMKPADLSRIDGIYNAVVYNSATGKVHLVSDRYGYRRLYWSIHNGELAWASEVKAFLGLHGYRPVLSEESLYEFLEIGYMLGDHTWFDGVKVLEPGSVLTWDTRERTWSMESYWFWDKITTSVDRIDEDEAAVELGRLFRRAVEKRSTDPKSPVVFLSGGLDSRAILAAIPYSGAGIHTMTFGKRGSDDLRIASRASAVKGATHCTCYIDEENWLLPRVAAVWYTDGMLDLLNMHGIEALPMMMSRFDFQLNGFAGDLVLGGSYIGTKTLMDSVNRKAVAAWMGCPEDALWDFDRFEVLSKADYYYLHNRVRRFTYEGLKMSGVFMEFRIPFFDNELIEFVYSFPDTYRYKAKLYKRMLLREFPEYFKRIPWQKTGAPIGWPNLLQDSVLLARKASRKLASRTGKSLWLSDSWGYSDYPKWMRCEPARSFLENVLRDKNALYPDFVPRLQVEMTLDEHMAGLDRSDSLLRYLTVELWLKQVDEGRCMEPGEFK